MKENDVGSRRETSVRGRAPLACERTAVAVRGLDIIAIATDSNKPQLKYGKFRDHEKNCCRSLYRTRDNRCGVHGVLLQVGFRCKSDGATMRPAGTANKRKY
jgi:hypothetical protein